MVDNTYEVRQRLQQKGYRNKKRPRGANREAFLFILLAPAMHLNYDQIGTGEFGAVASVACVANLVSP